MPIHEKMGAKKVSNSEMSDFFAEQGRTMIFGEAYFLYAATGKPRRTPLSGKMAIYGWTIDNMTVQRHNFANSSCNSSKGCLSIWQE